MLPMLVLAAVLAAGPAIGTAMTQDEAVQLARETVQGKLKNGREAMTVTSVQAMDWPDTSLGCPEPGMMYAQMIVPGYKVIIQVGDAFYPVHVGGGQAVLCTPRRNGRRNKDVVERANQIFTAREKVAAHLNVSIDQVQVLRPAETKGLACKPEAKKLIRLAYEGRHFVYDADADRVTELQCAPGKAAPR